METIGRFFDLPDSSCFLFGPRGTGKSTWLRTRLPDALYIDLLAPDVLRAYEARPERLIEVVRAQPAPRPVVVDEVQKVPDLLPAVHLLIEEEPRRRFVLTGSSARKLRRAGVNLLAGRAVRRTLHPFMAAELGARFRLPDALQLGLLPLVVAAAEPRDVLASYVGLYLREEVQAEGLTRSLGGFSRFLEAAAFSHAGVLNISNVARDCGVGRKTVEGYLGILDDLLLAFRLPVFERRAGRATAAHPKFFLFDAGVFRSLRPAGPLDRPTEIEGAALEGLVVQHVRAWAAYGGDRVQLHYWRTRAGNEVDLVAYGEDVFAAIEVKNTATVRPADLSGLRAFTADYPEARAILLYRGREPLCIDRVAVWPCEDFLRALRPGAALP